MTFRISNCSRKCELLKKPTVNPSHPVPTTSAQSISHPPRKYSSVASSAFPSYTRLQPSQLTLNDQIKTFINSILESKLNSLLATLTEKMTKLVAGIISDRVILPPVTAITHPLPSNSNNTSPHNQFQTNQSTIQDQGIQAILPQLASLVSAVTANIVSSHLQPQNQFPLKTPT